MTDADKPAFLQAIARLAVALREREPDVVQLQVYFTALRDLEVEFVVAAADRLVHAEFFPKVGEWRREAAHVERERTDALRERLRKLPTPLCAACGDTGWAEDPSATRVQHWRPPGQTDVVPIRASSAARRCDCGRLRRLEVLGRRPWPALPEDARSDVADEPPTPQASAEALTTLGARPRPMPSPSSFMWTQTEDENFR